MTYAIAFDVPDSNGDLSGQPFFGGIFVGYDGRQVPAFEPDLSSASLFECEEDADTFLAEHYGESIRPWGVVVEVPE